MLGTAAYASADSCTALVLSGGGANGAWESGVLWGMVNYGNPDDFAYDVVSGISAGAINTLALAGFETGKEKEAAQWLSDLWKNLKTSEVWQNWTLSIAEGLTMKGGLLDNSPLSKKLKDVSSTFTSYGRRVTLGAGDVNSGEFHVFTQKNVAINELYRAAVASASIPAVFPPYNWEGVGLFMDGGTINNVNIQGAIDQCLEMVNDESKITVDVFICGDQKGTVESEEKVGATISNYMRNRNIHSANSGENDLKSDVAAHPKVNFRYLVYETIGHAGGLSELTFDGDKTWPMQT